MSSQCPTRFALRIAPVLFVASLALAAIALSPAPRAGAADTTSTAHVPLKLPPDHVYADSVGPDMAVTFRHTTHVEYEGNRCTGCHPKLFRMLGPSPPNTHRVMNAGGQCGSCHNGRQAFDVRANESCPTCHAGRETAAAKAAGAAVARADSGTARPPAASAGPKPFVFRFSSDSPGPVTFRHETHRAKSPACTACHSKLFAMKAPVKDPKADYHDAGRCGACHDGKQAFGVEDDDGCPRCHQEEKGGK